MVTYCTEEHGHSKLDVYDMFTQESTIIELWKIITLTEFSEPCAPALEPNLTHLYFGTNEESSTKWA